MEQSTRDRQHLHLRTSPSAVESCRDSRAVATEGVVTVDCVGLLPCWTACRARLLNSLRTVWTVGSICNSFTIRRGRKRLCIVKANELLIAFRFVDSEKDSIVYCYWTVESVSQLLDFELRTVVGLPYFWYCSKSFVNRLAKAQYVFFEVPCYWVRRRVARGQLQHV